LHTYWSFRYIQRIYRTIFHSENIAVVLVINTRCNFKCENCPMYLCNGKQPKYDECTLDEWKYFISHYPNRIEEIFISGGEPTLVPYIAEFVNWLVKQKIHVCIFSNLAKPEAFLGLKKSHRLILYPTLHELYNTDRFRFAYFMLKDRVRVIPIELTENRRFGEISKSKDVYKLDYFVNEFRLHFAPDSPRTKRTYVASLNLYADGTPVGACNAVKAATENLK
jgi:hypothetical protein